MSWLQRVRGLFSSAFGGVEVSGVPGEGVARPFGPPASLTIPDGYVAVAVDHGPEVSWHAIEKSDAMHRIVTGMTICHQTRMENGYRVYRPV